MDVFAFTVIVLFAFALFGVILGPMAMALIRHDAPELYDALVRRVRGKEGKQ